MTTALKHLVLVAALHLLATAAGAQSYPDRPVKLMIGFAPGSSADVSSRILAEELSRLLGQRVIVEVRAGASSNIAADTVAKAEPDGYTLFLGSAANVINRSMRAAAAVDIGRDLKPVALVCALPNILVVHPDVKASSVAELIALAKAEPDKLNYGSPGIATSPHLSAELFKVMAGVRMVHVPYTGTAQAAQDLLAGRLHLMFSPASTALPHIEAKTLRALAWTMTTRGPSLPDLPTVAEAGLPGFDTSIWFGINAPPGLPDAIATRLADAIATAVAGDVMVRAFRVQGIEPLSGGPAVYASYIAAETAKWTDVVAKAGLAKP